MTKIDHFTLYRSKTKENMKQVVDCLNEIVKDDSNGLTDEEKCIILDLIVRMETVIKKYSVRDSKYIEGLIAGIEMYTKVFDKITF